jgi:hypothetical protein
LPSREPRRLTRPAPHTRDPRPASIVMRGTWRPHAQAQLTGLSTTRLGMAHDRVRGITRRRGSHPPFVCWFGWWERRREETSALAWPGFRSVQKSGSGECSYSCLMPRRRRHSSTWCRSFTQSRNKSLATRAGGRSEAKRTFAFS